MSYKTFFAFFFSIFCSIGFAYEPDLPEVTSLVQFSDLNEESLSAIFNGERPDIVLELKKGAFIPVKCTYHLGVFSVEDFPSFNVRVRENCFFRWTEDEGFVSFDGKTWKDLDVVTDLCCTKIQAKFDRTSQKLVLEIEKIECDCWDDE